MRLPKALPPETVPFFTTYLEMARIEPDQLVAQVRAYLDTVRAAAKTSPTIDVDLAERIGHGVEQLLAQAKSPDYPYVQAAAIYLIEDEDDQGRDDVGDEPVQPQLARARPPGEPGGGETERDDVREDDVRERHGLAVVLLVGSARGLGGGAAHGP